MTLLGTCQPPSFPLASHPLPADQVAELAATALEPHLSASWHVGPGLTLGNCNQSLNEMPWSWCRCTAIDLELRQTPLREDLIFGSQLFSTLSWFKCCLKRHWEHDTDGQNIEQMFNVLHPNNTVNYLASKCNLSLDLKDLLFLLAANKTRGE